MFNYSFLLVNINFYEFLNNSDFSSLSYFYFHLILITTLMKIIIIINFNICMIENLYYFNFMNIITLHDSSFLILYWN